MMPLIDSYNTTEWTVWNMRCQGSGGNTGCYVFCEQWNILMRLKSIMLNELDHLMCKGHSSEISEVLRRHIDSRRLKGIFFIYLFYLFLLFSVLLLKVEPPTYWTMSATIMFVQPWRGGSSTSLETCGALAGHQSKENVSIFPLSMIHPS